MGHYPWRKRICTRASPRASAALTRQVIPGGDTRALNIQPIDMRALDIGHGLTKMYRAVYYFSMSTPPPARPALGRPKDAAKREAVLAAARKLFSEHGLDGASMDQIAAHAGVSKLTVYSHFGDKENLFAEVVRSFCDSQFPSQLFLPQPGDCPRATLLRIGHAFFAMMMAPEAIAGHRILCSPKLAGSSLCTLFWEAGPQRIQQGLSTLLETYVAEGALLIDDIPSAASQFFTLIKGEPHAQQLFGFCCSGRQLTAQQHVDASVGMFLRAYARR